MAPTLSLSDEQQPEAETTAAPQIYDQSSNLPCGLSSSDPDFDDSGYQSADEQDSINNSPAPPLPTIRADHASASNEYATLVVETPKKSPLPASTDSAISLTFDFFGERQTKQSVADEIEPASPLAGKATKSKRGTADASPSRPAASPIQPTTFKRETESGSRPTKPPPRIFRPFKHPSKDMIKYIKRPLGSQDLKEGYIYCFQVEGCALNKVGSATLRKGDKSLMASFEKRMKEHERCGWHAEPVFKLRVPHAHRVERIIQHHFVAGRREEQNTCKGSNGRKCKHGIHIEWFEVPLDEIWTAVRAWSRWIETNPYVEINGNLCLSPEWIENLNTVGIESDHWLEWLYRYAPEPTAVIRAVALETRYSSGSTDPHRQNDPFISTARVRITKDHCDGETVHAPKDAEFPHTELPFRLNHSKTWPRKTNSAIREKD